MSRHYFNSKATFWDDQVAEKDASKLAGMVSKFEIKPDSRILDVGTGTGVLIPFLLERINENGRLVALDISEGMLAMARAKHFNGTVEYLQGDVANLPVTDECFDAVVCYSSFPHFRAKPRALREIFRVLKREGRLFVCHTSSRTTINEVHRQVPDLMHDLIPDETRMKSMVAGAGFQGISILDGAQYMVAASKP